MAVLSGVLEGPYRTNKEDATEFEIKYYVDEGDDADSYMQEYGDTATWAEDIATDITEPILVSKCLRSPVIPDRVLPCRVQIWATTNLHTSSSYTSVSYSSLSVKKYGKSEYYMHPDFFGVKKCTENDLDATKNNGKADLKQIDTATQAFVDTYVFKNHTNAIDGTWNYDLSVFANLSSVSAADKVKLVGTKLSAMVYTVKFYTRKDINAISDFTGTGLGTDIPSKYRPTAFATGTRIWLAIGDKLETVKDKNGVTWTEITRKLLKAPSISTLQFTWDQDKFGGSFDW